MTRDELQEQAVQLAKAEDRVLLSWATGVGKTLGFIKIQEALKAEVTYIIVAEVAHIKNWEDDYIKHGRKYLLAKTRIFCYASLKKNVNETIDLLCLDEAHHSASDMRLDHLSTLQATKIVALTATINQDQLIALQCVYGMFKQFKVSLAQAIDWGIIPEPLIYLIPLELENTKRNQTITQEWGTKGKRVTIYCKLEDKWDYMKDKIKYPHVKLIMPSTEKEKNDFYDAQSIYWKSTFMRTRQDFAKVKWMLAGTERKRFLAELKTNHVKPYIKLLRKNSKRFICFCGSIEQAETLGKNAIHSKMKDAASFIENFNDKKIDNLFVVNMLQEGQNLVDIDAGVIVQLDGQERGFIQKSGRVLRGTEPVLFVFYYRNTRDADYLANILENVDMSYIQTIEDISVLNYL